MKSQTKIVTTFIFLMIILTLFAGAFLIFSNNPKDQISGNSIVNGNSQILEIKAVNGGYSPNKLSAKAGIPGKIIFPKTQVFGCQNSVVIPELDKSATLSRVSDTEFAFEEQPVGKVLKGNCSMGMYDFEIVFN